MKPRLLIISICVATAACTGSQRQSAAADTPQPDSLAAADSSHAHNAEALQHIRQLLDEQYDSTAFARHTEYIMNWAMSSHDIDVNIDEQIGELMGTPYLTAYIAACAEAELRDSVPAMDWDRFIGAMSRLTAFYRANHEAIGTADRLERYAVLDSLQLVSTLREDFAELIH